MDIENAPGERFEQRSPNQPQKSRQTYQIDLFLTQAIGQRAIVGLTALVRAWIHPQRFDARVARPEQTGSVGAIRDHDRDGRIEASFVDGIYDRLEIAAAARDQHTEAAAHDV